MAVVVAETGLFPVMPIACAASGFERQQGSLLSIRFKTMIRANDDPHHIGSANLDFLRHWCGNRGI
jgi:hypothetical protein